MTTLLFDIETNGFLEDTNTIHCLVIQDADTGRMWSCTDNCDPTRPNYTSVEDGLKLLAEADMIVGHNIIGFDLPAIQKVYPDFTWKGTVRDTLILGYLLYPKEVLRDSDFRLAEKGKLPKNLIGLQKLEAWGHRYGNYKGDYKGPWDRWSSTMQDYCEQDVRVTATLWKHQQEELADGWGTECVELEHDLAWIIERQTRRGFSFNEEAARALYGKLAGRKAELADELSTIFPPKVVRTPFTPKANNAKRGYVKGVPTFKEKVVPFNPGSRKQVAERMMALGWQPTEFGKDGTPKVDDDTLGKLPYPEAKLLAEFFLIAKRMGQLGDGREAWMQKVRKGRVHGWVIQNGAVTGRMTHRVIANVPAERTVYGHEMRALFTASTGFKLVGCDADALELRCLAGFMARHDGGAYIRTVLEGRKEDGTDMHTLNAKALGCSRDVAKTWFYAFIYGAGDAKLGFTLLGALSKARLVGAGRAARAKFLANLPALAKLVKAVDETINGKRTKTGKVIKPGRGYLKGLDGRKLRIRSAHAALNTLLQSAGAVLMKKAQVILDADIQAAGLVPGRDYEFVITYHDEWQIEALPQHAELVGTLAADAIRKAGEFFAFRCPLKGNFDIGDTWAETH